MLSLHGSLLCKLWQGPETKGNPIIAYIAMCVRVCYPISSYIAFIKDLSSNFNVVTSMRPKATRKNSSEIYIIAKDFIHINNH